MSEEPKKPVLPLVSAVVERLGAVREAVRGPQIPPAPPEGEPVQVEPVVGHEPPPIPAPGAGQTIPLISADLLRVEPRAAPISPGAKLVAWKPLGSMTEYTYDDGTVLVFNPRAGSRGGYRLLGGPATRPADPPLPNDAPAPPVGGQVLDGGPGVGQIVVPADVVFVRSVAWPSKAEYVYKHRDGRRAFRLLYAYDLKTWNAFDESVEVPLERAQSGFKMRDL